MTTNEMQVKIDELEDLIGKAKNVAEIAALIQAQALLAIAQAIVTRSC